MLCPMSSEDEASKALEEFHQRERGAASYPFSGDAYRAGWDDASQWWASVAEAHREQLVAVSTAYAANLELVYQELLEHRVITQDQRTQVVHAIQHVAQGCISYEFEQALTDAVLRTLEIRVSDPEEN